MKKINCEVDSCLLIICVYAIYTHITQYICQSFLDIFHVCINEKAKYIDTIVNLISIVNISLQNHFLLWLSPKYHETADLFYLNSCFNRTPMTASRIRGRVFLQAWPDDRMALSLGEGDSGLNVSVRPPGRV